jgi:hypothetical protein
MHSQFNPQIINPWLEQLNHHPIYHAIQGIEDLRRFMAHHIYSVWDFMSLVKYLQYKIAPSNFPWQPQGSGNTRRFINSLVLEEESDEGVPTATGEATYGSHFELYCQSMREIGGDSEPALRFVALATQEGIATALRSEWIPAPSRHFTATTFAYLATDKPHLVAAALAMGREHVIPNMFRALLAKMGITPQQAPSFHYYLSRHIHLDEDFHAPLSLQLLQELCANDVTKINEAEQAAIQAITARIRFWNEVLESIRN